MREYLDKVLSQIRCKKARPYIEQEIKDHIEEQLHDNIVNGIEPREALSLAVKDMGDPVETGVLLDKVHRPKIAWRVLIFVALISVAGILVQYFIYKQQAVGNDDVFKFRKYVFGTIIGYAIMVGIYFIDYTFIVKYARLIGTAILGFTIAVSSFGVSMRGSTFYFVFMGKIVSTFSIMMMYIPVYAAILYKCRLKKSGQLSSAFIWGILPVMVSLGFNHNIFMVLIIYTSAIALVITAVLKGWFDVNKKLVVSAILFMTTVYPLGAGALLFFSGRIPEYRKARLEMFFSRGTSSESYIQTVLDGLRESSRMWGNSGAEISKYLPSYNCDNVFVSILGSFGIIAAVLVAMLISGLIIMIFQIAFKQKNEVGSLMCFGCGMYFLVATAVNVLCNLNLLPYTSTFLPFFSYGVNNQICGYIFLGIVISVFRYKDVYPKHLSNWQKIGKIV